MHVHNIHCCHAPRQSQLTNSCSVSTSGRKATKQKEDVHRLNPNKNSEPKEIGSTWRRRRRRIFTTCSTIYFPQSRFHYR